jgi:hypothetical protein
MTTDGSTLMLMIPEGLDVLHLSAIALTVAVLTARIASKKDGSFFKWFIAGAFLGIFALPLAIAKRKKVALPALKKCPKCAEQLSVSALVCDVCDYNFLSGMVGHSHKLLPPREPLVHEASTQTFAYRA